MNFGLLLSQLPHVEESRAHYDAMLALHAREPNNLFAFWCGVKPLVRNISANFRHTQPASSLVTTGTDTGTRG
jgi:hypothetical protein